MISISLVRAIHEIYAIELSQQLNRSHMKKHQGDELIPVIYIPFKHPFIFVALVKKALYVSILSCIFGFNFASSIVHIFPL